MPAVFSSKYVHSITVGASLSKASWHAHLARDFMGGTPVPHRNPC